MWALPVYAVVFRASRLYRGMWVLVSVPVLMRTSKEVASGALIVTIGSAMLQPSPKLAILYLVGPEQSPKPLLTGV
jgi:hypothetical protein